jgi:PadR family transcriptional regulator, regulatory protein AphA
MSLRHAVLGLLMLEPTTGYDLTQRFDRSLSNAWHASHSQIYPELAKLEAEGLVEVLGEGPSRSKTWAVTKAGREELRRWLMETEPNRAQRNETALRWFLVFRLEPEQRREVLERELAFVETAAEQRRVLAEQLDAEGKTGGFRPVLELGARVDPAMIGWLREQIEATRRT